MFKLVKNEFYKIFHKKSTYITMLVFVAYIILTNVIYKNMNNYMDISYSDPYYLNNLKEEISNFNKDTGNMEEYASLMASYEIQNYVQEKKNSWQIQKYHSNITNSIYTYYEKLYVYNDEDGAKQIRDIIDSDIKKLEEGDWKYFAQKDLNNINENIQELKNTAVSVGEISRDLEIYEYQKYLIEYRLENDVSYEDSYLNTALNNLEDLINAKINYETAKTKETKDAYKDDYGSFFENEYIIKNKVDTNNEQSLSAIIKNFFGEYLFLIIVFIVMIAGAIVSDEFSKGTVKSLLTLPYTRGKILMSKLITIILMIPVITLFILFIQLIMGGITFGFSSLNVPVIGYSFKLNAIETMSIGQYFFLNFIGILPMLLLLGTLAFALSSLLCSTAFAITITFCGYIGSELINSFAYYREISFLNYFVTTNWDLRYAIFGGTSMFNIPIAQSIITCLVYFIIMVLITLILFKKKNIKNI